MSNVLLWCILLLASYYDIRYQRIPDWLTLSAITLGIILTHNWLGAIVGAGCIIIVGSLGLAILKQETMGGADVKLMAAVGAFLGTKVALLSFFLAPCFALLYGALTKKARQREIPYVPVISLAAWVSYLWVSIGF